MHTLGAFNKVLVTRLLLSHRGYLRLKCVSELQSVQVTQYRNMGYIDFFLCALVRGIRTANSLQQNEFRACQSTRVDLWQGIIGGPLKLNTRPLITFISLLPSFCKMVSFIWLNSATRWSRNLATFICMTTCKIIKAEGFGKSDYLKCIGCSRERISPQIRKGWKGFC